LISTLVLAAVATCGDWYWANYVAAHTVVAGLVHGAAFCLAMGAVLGQPLGRAAVGAIGGVAIGVLAAGIFYALAPAMRYMAMLPAWFALWVMLALLVRWFAPAAPLRLAVTRGIMAGVASGLAFYLVSGMWTRWNPQTMNYVDHFLRWTFAFAPGFMILQGGRIQRREAASI